MNIVEAAKKMKPGDKVESQDAQAILIMVDNGYKLRYIDHQGVLGGKFEFNANEFLAYDWEIIKEIDWVDFWTAWQAHRHGRRIRSQFWHEYCDYDLLVKLGHFNGFFDQELNGMWEIID